jgi:uncharacterized protein DUF928
MRKIISGLLACLIIACYVLTRASELELKAIVPDHVGYTLKRSPVIYYFISKPTSLPTRFTLRDPRTAHPVVDVLLKSPSHSGLWPIRFADYDIVLDPGVQYRWFVSIIQDFDSLSKDIVAGGVIECCSEDLLFIWDARRCDKETVHAYARSGIWYDAFACVTELIEVSPEDQELRRMRNELLGIHLLEVSFMQKSSLSPFHVSSKAFCLPEFLCKGGRFRAYTVVVVPALRGSALRTLRSHVWLRERIGNTFVSPRRQKWYLPGGPPQI